MTQNELINGTRIDTYGVKYIGSKKKILPIIGGYVNQLNIKTAIDVFTGTTRVAQYFRQMGLKTTTSDLSWASKCYAHTFVHNKDNKHLQPYIDKMNSLEPYQGWLASNYSGEVAEAVDKGTGRCWKLKNSMRADAARDYVEDLTRLEPWEKDTLITSIIMALDKVDNTVGVQQAYLKQWCARSKNDIFFQLPPPVSGPTATHLEGDALKLEYPPADMAYLDPPYSPHSYSTYYHIWDSIVKWDKPQTSLTAKRRNDRVSKHEDYDSSMESDWNVRGKALKAFDNLIDRLPVRYVIVSYSDESIVLQDDLRDVCIKHDVHRDPLSKEISYKRNIMSQIGRSAMGKEGEDAPKKDQKNKELIIIVDKKG